MRIATWNVNGIRARAGQIVEWAAADRPDIICLQELKAAPDQIPEECRLAGYETLWHGQKGYSGVSLHVREGLAGKPPKFGHPEIDFETRVVQAEIGDLVVASIYLPNGGKDYDAKLRFLGEMEDWVGQLVDGEPLSKVIERKGLTIDGTVGIAAQIFDGLSAAHEAGVIHRDMKPDNILIDKRGPRAHCGLRSGQVAGSSDGDSGR